MHRHLNVKYAILLLFSLYMKKEELEETISWVVQCSLMPSAVLGSYRSADLLPYLLTYSMQQSPTLEDTINNNNNNNHNNNNGISAMQKSNGEREYPWNIPLRI